MFSHLKLSSAEKSFLEKRWKLASAWPWVGTGLLATLLALTTYLWVKAPYLVNPWFVASQLKSGKLSESTITVLAVMLPIVMLGCLVIILSVVLLSFAAFSNERRIIRILHQLLQDRENLHK